MNAPICMFCKHCERMSLKNRRVTYIRRCTKHNTVVVSTTKECKDYEKGYRDYRSIMDTAKPDDCPLVEIPTPHGRLIDIKSVEDGKFVTVSNDYQRWWNGALESVIDNAPTVIEGSET